MLDLVYTCTKWQQNWELENVSVMVEKTVDPVLSTWGCLNRQSRSSAAKLVDAKICVTSFEIFLLVTENCLFYL